MDKFDEFLNKRAKDENKDFVLSEFFELKIDETLKGLENNKKEKLYKNKKIISMVACFSLIFLVGLRYLVFNNSLGSNKGRSSEIYADSGMRRDINQSEKKSYNTDDYGTESNQGVIINKSEVQGLVIKSLSGESKFKFINNKEDIKIVIDLINNLHKSEVIDQGISDWDFLIQTSGLVNHIIEIKGNLISVDNKYYKSEEDISQAIGNIYSNLSYEEKEIKYCNITY